MSLVLEILRDAEALRQRALERHRLLFAAVVVAGGTVTISPEDVLSCRDKRLFIQEDPETGTVVLTVEDDQSS